MRRFRVGLQEGVVHALLDGGIAHQHEAPGLHEADRGGEMGGGQDAGKQGVVDGVGNELAAHVAARQHVAVDDGA